MDDKTNLGDLRDRIDKIDRELVILLNKRAEVSVEVGRRKAAFTGPVFKPFREKEVYDKLLALNSGPLPEKHLLAIYREIISSSRRLQRPDRVVYLGPEGTFSHFAGLEFLGRQADMIPKRNFEEIFRAVTLGEAELGVIPLENSLQGTVGQNVDLFLRYPVHIQAEVFSRISHALMGTAESLAEIEEIYSHAQPLEQCRAWLQTNLSRAGNVPVESTAAAARRVAELGSPKVAAVAHRRMAGMTGLKILADRIEDMPDNWTRFLIIGPKPPDEGKRDKTSILFTTPDKPGALATVLDLFAGSEVNITKLESRPLSGERWKYVFFADLECDLSAERYDSLLTSLKDHCQTLRILGSYPTGPYLDGGSA